MASSSTHSASFPVGIERPERAEPRRSVRAVLSAAIVRWSERERLVNHAQPRLRWH